MKHARLVAFTAAAGVAVILMAGTGTPAQDPSGGDPLFHHPGPPPEIRVAGIYDPRDAVRLVGSYQVPAGKTLIVTAVGSYTGGLAFLEISPFWPVGGAEQIRINTLPTDPTVEFPPPGIAVPAGRNITCSILYGYLIEGPASKGKVRSTAPQTEEVQVIGIPGDPRDFVYLRQDLPGVTFGYLVPQGRRLLITGFGGSWDSTASLLRVNGNDTQRVEFPAGRAFYQLPPPGIPVQGGGLVQVAAESPWVPYPGRVFGYLIDE